MMSQVDAIVVGSGPNGLAAAITLAEQGRSVHVVEASDRVGGGTRTAELTLPGFRHDVCSAIHPLAVVSEVFRSAPLGDFGLEWIDPAIPLAHPISGGQAACLRRSLAETARGFGGDGPAYQRLLSPFCKKSETLLAAVLSPLQFPRNPLLMARFGWHGIGSSQQLVDRWFRDERVRGMFAGAAAHSILPLDQRTTAAVGLMFCVSAHGRGWPFPRGGSEQIAIAMRRYLESLGGTVEVNRRVESLDELGPAKAVLFDVSPVQLVQIAGQRLPTNYRRKLLKFRHGPGAFKLDLALREPVPWAAEVCRQAGTVHVGGTFEEIAAAEQLVADGKIPERPFVLVAQQSLFDDSRAPQGRHTLWAYCHVPANCDVDMTDRIEAQIERFAPGFRDLILAKHRTFPRELEAYNNNYIGGDISGGVMDLRQILARPTASFNPYRTPAGNLFLCSASTPPGPGVHGMCGRHAGLAALRTVLR